MNRNGLASIAAGLAIGYFVISLFLPDPTVELIRGILVALISISLRLK